MRRSRRCAESRRCISPRGSTDGPATTWPGWPSNARNPAESMTATNATVPERPGGTPRPASGGRSRADDPAPLPFLGRERRYQRQQAEVDVEGLAVLGPRPAARRQHPRPRDPAVDDDCEGERGLAARRARGYAIAFERGPREEQYCRRPAAQPLRVLRRRLPVRPALLQAHATASATARHRAQDQPEVSEDDDKRNEPGPRTRRTRTWAPGCPRHRAGRRGTQPRRRRGGRRKAHRG